MTYWSIRGTRCPGVHGSDDAGVPLAHLDRPVGAGRVDRDVDADVPHRRAVTARERPGRLTGRPDGDVLTRGRDGDGRAEQVGGHLLHRLRRRRAADEQHAPHRAADVPHAVDGGGEPEQHPLHDGTGEVLGRRVGAGQPVQRPGRAREVGGALTVQVGQQRQAACARLRGEGEPVEPGEVGAEHRRARGEHASGVEGADERQEAALGVREGLHRPRGVGRRAVVPGERRAARAERDDDVARGQAEPEGRSHVVAGPRRDRDAGCRAPHHLRRRGHPRHGQVGPVGRVPEEVEAVVAAARRPVAGAGRVAGIGRPPVVIAAAVPEDAAGEPVVGEHAGAGAGKALRLVARDPAQLAHRGRRDRYDPGGVGPGLRPQLVDEVGGRRRRAGVVPEERRAHHGVGLVEQHHAVLLAPDGEGGDILEQSVGGRLLPGRPPVARFDLGAVRVGGAPHADDLAGLGVAHDDLARLGRGVDPGDESSVGHLRPP